jgi:hypothetical protein
MANKTGRGQGRVKPPNLERLPARARRAMRAAAEQAPVVPDQPAQDHPGVLAAHDGRVTADECGHPAGRRDAKNPGFCHACGTGGLTPPPARRR